MNVVVAIVFSLIFLILASIFIPDLDILWGNIFQSWTNTLMVAGGFTLLMIAIARLK
jgi:hypothetical protein